MWTGTGRSRGCADRSTHCFDHVGHVSTGVVSGRSAGGVRYRGKRHGGLCETR